MLNVPYFDSQQSVTQFVETMASNSASPVIDDDGNDGKNFVASNVESKPRGHDKKLATDHQATEVVDEVHRATTTAEPSSPMTAKFNCKMLPAVVSKSDVEVVDGKEKKIPRPMNSFMLFAHDNRRKLKTLFPTEDNKSISVRLGKAWRELNLLDKQKYFDQAQEVEKLHKAKYPNYTYSPGVARRRKANRRMCMPIKPYPRTAAATKSANQVQVVSPVQEKCAYIPPTPVSQHQNQHLFRSSVGTSSTVMATSPHISRPLFQNTAPVATGLLLPNAIPAEPYSPAFQLSGQLGLLSPAVLTTGAPAGMFAPYLAFSSQSGLSHIFVGGQGDTNIGKFTTAHMTLPVQACQPVTQSQMQYIAPIPVCSTWMPSPSTLPTVTSFHNVCAPQNQFRQNPDVLQQNTCVTGLLQDRRIIQSPQQLLRFDHDYAASIPPAEHDKDKLCQAISSGVILAAPEAGDAGLNNIRSADTNYLLAHIYNVPCSVRCPSHLTGSVPELSVGQKPKLESVQVHCPTTVSDAKIQQCNNSSFMQVAIPGPPNETLMPFSSAAAASERTMTTTNDNYSTAQHFIR